MADEAAFLAHQAEHPGLVEPHAHLSFADVTSYELTRMPLEEHLLATVRNAHTMLDAGYTSALSAAAAKPRLDVVVKREIEAGRLLFGFFRSPHTL